VIDDEQDDSPEQVETPIGVILDGLDITATLTPNQRITEALVIAKVYDLETNDPPSIGLFYGPSTDWISRLGLLDAANLVMKSPQCPGHDPEED
jgi:hypothetical protein